MYSLIISFKFMAMALSVNTQNNHGTMNNIELASEAMVGHNIV